MENIKNMDRFDPRCYFRNVTPLVGEFTVEECDVADPDGCGPTIPSLRFTLTHMIASGKLATVTFYANRNRGDEFIKAVIDHHVAEIKRRHRL